MHGFSIFYTKNFLIKDTGDSLNSIHWDFTSPLPPQLLGFKSELKHATNVLKFSQHYGRLWIAWQLELCVSMISVSGSITSIIVWGGPQKLINTDPWYFPCALSWLKTSLLLSRITKKKRYQSHGFQRNFFFRLNARANSFVWFFLSECSLD